MKWKVDREYWNSVAVLYRLVKESLINKVLIDLRPEDEGLNPIEMWKKMYWFQEEGRGSENTMSMTIFDMFEG